MGQGQLLNRLLTRSADDGMLSRQKALLSCITFFLSFRRKKFSIITYADFSESSFVQNYSGSLLEIICDLSSKKNPKLGVLFRFSKSKFEHISTN